MTFKAKTGLKCRHCEKVIFSQRAGDYVSHTCDDAGLVSHAYDHETDREVAARPYFAIDETSYYCRIIGYKEDFEVIDL